MTNAKTYAERSEEHEGFVIRLHYGYGSTSVAVSATRAAIGEIHKRVVSAAPRGVQITTYGPKDNRLYENRATGPRPRREFNQPLYNGDGEAASELRSYLRSAGIEV